MSTEHGAAQSPSTFPLRLALAVLVPLALPLAAQAPEWIKQAPLPTGGSFDSVAVLSATEIWGAAGPLLGNLGTLAHTATAGKFWDVQEFTSGQLNAVFFLDALHGWAAGNGFHHTTDGGLSWIDASPPAGSFRAICFLDTLTGWVAGDGIYRTTNGGATWTQQHSGGAALADISFADRLNGWASGYANTLLHTADGGQTWTPQLAPGAPSLTAFQGVSAVSATEAWVAGWYGYVARTTDGGQTWVQEQLPGASGAYLECAAFTDAEIGWVAGDLGIWHRGTAALAASPSSISIEAGGTQTFALDAGPALAGEIYFLLGTLAGTEPGIPVGSFTLPLNPDFYFLFSLANPNQPPLASTFGTLDTNGRASASLTLGAGQVPLLLGLQAHHAFAVIDSISVSFVSNAVSLSFPP